MTSSAALSTSTNAPPDPKVVAGNLDGNAPPLDRTLDRRPAKPLASCDGTCVDRQLSFPRNPALSCRGVFGPFNHKLWASQPKNTPSLTDDLDGASEQVCYRCWPTTVGAEQAICPKYDGASDYKGIGQSKARLGSQDGSLSGDRLIDRYKVDGEGSEQAMDARHRVRTSSARANKDLCQCRCRQGKLVKILFCYPESFRSRDVVDITTVENTDQHARVEDNQSHSCRKRSSSSLSQTPVRAPA